MNGKKFFKLVPSVVKDKLNDGTTGTYLLGKFSKDKFYVVYVGRSRCLRRRLLEHAKTRESTYFCFEPAPDLQAAARHEAVAYHAFLGLDNKIRPAKPKNARIGIYSCEHEIRSLFKRITGAI